MLHAVGVLAVATIGRTAARLRVAGAPCGRPKAAQRGGRMERASTDLAVVGLHNGAAKVGPVLRKGQDHVLERQDVACILHVPLLTIKIGPTWRYSVRASENGQKMNSAREETALTSTAPK